MSDDLLFQRAARFSSRIAVVDHRGDHRFSELDARARAIAAALLDGAADLAEARVGYLIPPSFDHVATQWGIWRAGAIAVPIAASHPAREIEYLLDDCRPVAVVTSRDQWERVGPMAAARGVRVLISDDLPASRPASAFEPAAERRALIIYTSGTTGRPKGVVTSHATVRAQVATLVDAWGWTADDRSLHVLPLHHVHGIVNALGCALWCGASVEFLDPFDAVPCWERLASGAITVFTAVPTIYGRLITAFDGADDPTRLRWAAGVRRLRLMMSGSAALPVSVLERWATITDQRLLERYGMTEIGMALGNPLSGERRAGTVGQPFAGVAARLVDEAGAVCPPGVAGQIEIKSPQMFREYWNRPEETARAFRDGWFATGDVAVVDDGYWRILGRQSVDIIKSAGYKISALEIEEILREHPAVADCAVIGRPDDDLGERIGAAVVLTEPASPDQLRVWLKERLAPYKVPRDVIAVAELPRNAMGKVTKSEVKALFAV